ncbi:MAG: lipoprotein [Kiloniellales bacterium]|nr:lipoprotein [Kiloniellales bacterium]
MIGRRGTIAATLLLVLALVLGGCGRKGDLRPPEGEEDAYTGTGIYPAPESVVPQEGEASALPESEEDPEAGEEGTGGS